MSATACGCYDIKFLHNYDPAAIADYMQLGATALTSYMIAAALKQMPRV